MLDSMMNRDFKSLVQYFFFQTYISFLCFVIDSDRTKFLVLFIFAGLSLLSIFSKFSHSKLSGVTILEKSYLTDEIDFKPSDNVKKEAQWNELSKRKAFAAHDFGLH